MPNALKPKHRTAAGVRAKLGAGRRLAASAAKAPSYSINQVGPDQWELRHNGEPIGEPYRDRVGNSGYDQACTALGAILAAQLVAELAGTEGGDGAGDAGSALLPERWTSEDGICFSIDTAGGRDFTECSWSWRDPETCLVPLMFQTENEGGHWGAELAGFIEEFSGGGVGQVDAAGRFYNSDVGVQARDTLLGGGRFGVSVDPSENVVADFREECVEQDEDGWCTAWDFSVVFTEYEIAGLTMTPFPCFENAQITIDAAGSDGGSGEAALRATAKTPAKPPRAWLSLAEPQPGEDFLDGLGDDVLVEQRDRNGEVVALACPLTLSPEGYEGLVFGHLTSWGQCHVAEPWGPGVCASAQPSENDYADFRTGVTVCDDGTRVATGVLTVGCEHSYAMDVAGVRDHLAHSGMGWADVAVTDGEFGPWICGVLRPDVTEAQLRVLRSLSLSGEWVGELAGILAVNVPGLPVQRSLAASAFPGKPIAQAKLSASARKGGITSIIGGQLVRRCPECEERARQDRLSRADGSGLSREVLRTLALLERRTRHLVPAEAAATRARLTPAKA